MRESEHYEDQHASVKNAEGNCALCDRALGWYDSKFVEQNGPRIVCAESCLSVNGFWPKGYRYWTDG